MKKFVKKSLIAALAIVSALSLLTLAACDMGGGGGGGKNSANKEPSDYANVYYFEAELTCADEWVGGGWSGGQSGTGLIIPDADKIGASNGFYLTYTWSEGLCVYFEITATEDATAKLSLRLGNEIGAVELNPDRFAVEVNDVEFDYTPFTLKAGDAEHHKATGFENYAVGEISLKKGANVVALCVGDWRFDDQHVFGPVIDAIKVECNSTLSMVEYPENIENK